MCGWKVEKEKTKAESEDKKDLRWTMENRQKEEEAADDRKKMEDIVPKRFHRWLKVLRKQESKRMLCGSPGIMS